MLIALWKISGLGWLLFVKITLAPNSNLNYCVIWKSIIKLNFYLILLSWLRIAQLFFFYWIENEKKTVELNWMLEVTFGQINISRNSNLNQEKGSFLESLNICSGAKSYEKWGCFTSFWKHVFFSRHTLFFFLVQHEQTLILTLHWIFVARRMIALCGYVVVWTFSWIILWKFFLRQIAKHVIWQIVYGFLSKIALGHLK